MKHLLIPDCQVKTGDPIDHLVALGNYIVEKQPEVIVNIGDFADMPSLSSYEKKGSKYFEGKRYSADIASARSAMKALLSPIEAYNDRQRSNKKKIYTPRMILTLGNHENRISRALNEEPKLDGVLDLRHLHYEKHWEVHNFLDIVEVDGIAYSHYFVNPDGYTSHPIGGTINNKLMHLGCSFTMGHQQHRQYGTKFTAMGKELHGLVAGSFYQHDEDYLGPQKNKEHWRGIVMKHEVREGTYDPSFISLDYLLRKYL